MKIALALETFSAYAGGAESYAVHLARTLVREGWEVHLYGYSWDGDPPDAVFHPIRPLPRWFFPSVRILYFALEHRRLVQGEDFDVVLGFGNTLMMNVYQSHGGVHAYSSERKLKAVGSPIVRGMKSFAMSLTPKYHARKWIESAPFRMRPRPVIIAIADMIKRDMSAYYGVAEEEIRLVYNGIPQSKFSGLPDEHRVRVRDLLGLRDQVRFLFMAYDFRKKGVRQLIEAAGRLKQRVGNDRFGVVVVGNTPSPALRRLVDRLDLMDTVVFHGPTREPEAFYKACDVFVLPTFYDACSLVVFEAMAAGLPVITTVSNGAAGIITPGVDGETIRDPRRTDELAWAMNSYLDRDHLHASSRAATRTAASYTVEENHRRMLEIFREVASRRSQRQSV